MRFHIEIAQVVIQKVEQKCSTFREIYKG